MAQRKRKRKRKNKSNSSVNDSEPQQKVSKVEKPAEQEESQPRPFMPFDYSQVNYNRGKDFCSSV